MIETNITLYHQTNCHYNVYRQTDSKRKSNCSGLYIAQDRDKNHETFSILKSNFKQHETRARRKNIVEVEKYKIPRNLVIQRLQSTRSSATDETARCVKRPFKITRGHPLLWQSTRHMRLPI